MYILEIRQLLLIQMNDETILYTEEVIWIFPI